MKEFFGFVMTVVFVSLASVAMTNTIGSDIYKQFGYNSEYAYEKAITDCEKDLPRSKYCHAVVKIEVDDGAK